MTAEEHREYNRKWYQEHAEEQREKARRYYHENKEKIKEYNRNWREKNVEHVKEMSRMRQYNKEWHHQYNKKHRQELNEYCLKWRAEHPEHVKRQQQRRLQHKQDRYHNDPAYRGRWLFYNYKRLDIKKNVAPTNPSDYPTRDEYVAMFMQPCVFCGETDWHKIGLDRIDNTKGHTRDNLQPCCWSCNSKKKNMSVGEFRQAIADGRIKLKAVKAVKTEACDRAVPAMPNMRSLLSE